MNESNPSKDPLPDDFSTLEEAAAFWDSHDLSDYWDETTEVEFDVRAPRHQWIPLASHLASQTAARAFDEGVSIETLVNLWIAERLASEGG